MNQITKHIKQMIESNKIRIMELEKLYNNTSNTNEKIEIMNIINEYKENSIKFSKLIEEGE
jgi:hypothetical protein